MWRALLERRPCACGRSTPHAGGRQEGQRIAARVVVSSAGVQRSGIQRPGFRCAARGLWAAPCCCRHACGLVVKIAWHVAGLISRRAGCRCAPLRCWQRQQVALAADLSSVYLLTRTEACRAFPAVPWGFLVWQPRVVAMPCGLGCGGIVLVSRVLGERRVLRSERCIVCRPACCAGASGWHASGGPHCNHHCRFRLDVLSCLAPPECPTGMQEHAGLGDN